MCVIDSTVITKGRSFAAMAVKSLKFASRASFKKGDRDVKLKSWTDSINVLFYYIKRWDRSRVGGGRGDVIMDPSDRLTSAPLSGTKSV